ncbi:MAG: TonB-dependent receptor [Gammaproteobacteria bacterium]|nr:TonB-dependent receptor [Gammaproteobacteria bacterium]
MRAWGRMLLLLSAFGSTFTHAANLEISVLEKGSGDPLEGATVVIKQTGDYDTTNKNGLVQFEGIELPVDIKILNSGYATIEQTLDAPSLTVYLDLMSFEGEGVEVVAERVKEKSSKFVLQQEELRRIPGTSGDPIKVIETLPGIVSGGGGGGGGGEGGPGAIYVRGSGGGENSWWVNRIPIDYLYHTWNISVINPSLVQDFNIFLGGFPVEYEDRLGGVVDIKLRNPKNDRLHQTYRVALNESAGLLEGPIDKEGKHSFYIAARASYIDKVLSPVIDDLSKLVQDPDSDTNVSVITLPKYWDAQANWHYELNKGSADLLYLGSGDGLAFDIKSLDTADPQLLGILDAKWGFHSLGLNLRYQLAPTLTGQMTASLKNVFSHQQMGSDENGDPFFVDLQQLTSLAHPQLFWTPFPRHEFSLGSHLFYGLFPLKLNISSTPTEEGGPQGSFTSAEKFKIDKTVRAGSIAPYLKWRWSIMDSLKATLGLRYSLVRASDGVDMSDYTPRGSLEYQATDNLLLTASWGRFIQIPQEAQLVKGYGNPDLGFTRSEHRILGAQYKVNNDWMVQLEGYHKPMNDLVLTYPALPPNIYKNHGKGEAYGIDLLIKRKYANRKMGWLSYSYARSSRTTILDIERDFSADQPHTLNFVWSQPMGGSWSKWSWGVRVEAHSGRPYTPIVGREAQCNNNGQIEPCADQANAADDPNLSHWNPIYEGERNSSRRPFFHQVDLRLDRLIRYNTWNLNLYLDLRNVTFTRSIVFYDYGKDYEDYENPKKTGFPPIVLPFFGMEANF